MFTKSFSLELVVGNVEVSNHTAITSVLQKPLETIEHTQDNSKQHLAQLSLVSLAAPTFDHVHCDLSVNRIGELAQLSDTYSYWKIESSIVVSPHKNIEFTNKIVRRGDGEYPLFYGMELPSNVTRASAASYLRDSSQFYWEFDEATKVIWCNTPDNGSTFWDEDLVDYRGIVVTYHTATDSFSTLFNSQVIYREATVDDVDLGTLTIPETLPVYTVEKLMGGRYRYTLNGPGPFYVRQPVQSTVEVRKSVKKDLKNPWFLSIYGSTATYQGGLYNLVEMESIRYYPYKPYVTVKDKAQYVGPNTIRVYEPNLYVDPARNLHLSLIVRDSNQEIKYILSTSNRFIGKPFDRWNSRDYSSTMKWQRLEYAHDSRVGIIQVKNEDVKILDTDNVEATYVVEQKWYTYRHLNLNPMYNHRLQDTMYVVYMVNESKSETENRSIWHIGLRINGDGEYVVVESPLSNSLLGLTLEEAEEYCKDMGWGWLKLTNATLLDKPIEQTHIDIRLSPGVNKSIEETVYRRHTSIWEQELGANNQESPESLTWPDKFYLTTHMDTDHLYEADRSKWEGLCRRHVAAGSYIDIQKVKEARVERMFSLDGLLNIRLMPEAPHYHHRLFRCLGEMPDTTTDPVVGSTSLTYGKELVTWLVDVSTLEGKQSFYVCLLDTRTSKLGDPTPLYTLMV